MTKHLRRASATLLSTKRQKPALQLVDEEFGAVICRRSNLSRYVRLRLGPDGQLRATLPRSGTLKHVQQLINGSRDELRRLIAEQDSKQSEYYDGQKIGQSHQLEIVSSETLTMPSHRIMGQKIIVTVPDAYAQTQSVVRTAIKEALKKEAKAYLPRRLSYLAQQYGMSYEKVRFANQSGRWGSCSSTGTISLNIALMNLPLELVDYVLTHELCHTVHLHHQQPFWALVESHMQHYKQLRKQLKTRNPHI